MLSFAEGSVDWPITSNGFDRNVLFRHFGRSMSMPSESSSDRSENSSPVDEIKFEDVFCPQPETPVRRLSIQEKKANRRLRVEENREKVMELEKCVVGENENSKDKKKEKKKKKWSKMELSDFGFNMSLLPRPTKTSHINDEEVHRLLEEIDQEYLTMEEKITPFEHLQKYEGKKLENKYLREDRDRKIRKAHKQIKDKHCKNVLNNEGRKKLYVHHRVIKRMELDPYRVQLHYPMPPRKSLRDNPQQYTDTNNDRSRPAPVQNLNHALHNGAVPDDLPTDLISLLISLQHRDLSPEDYETLLRLDESVAPKTVAEDILGSFKTDIVDAESAGEMCAVCMDPYEVGQTRKFLPCDHVFHDSCIDMWLKNSSMNCPLDGLSVSS
ncbi:uncharacterized protein LOC124285780 [Haliotis rubra]|uniref:uncharacterized protein LOC124285780 n=1 Tax=Haliotis rubra TaxID=36100 RepID=UPI001EE5DF33|nr:uncharacterized protein LOC124285780 [Haliotis rubra]